MATKRKFEETEDEIPGWRNFLESDNDEILQDIDRKLIEIALFQGDLQSVKFLIDKGVDVLKISINQKTKNKKEKKCIELVKEKQQNIICNVLCPYLIDDLCKLVFSFYFY